MGCFFIDFIYTQALRASRTRGLVMTDEKFKILNFSPHKKTQRFQVVRYDIPDSWFKFLNILAESVPSRSVSGAIGDGLLCQ